MIAERVTAPEELGFSAQRLRRVDALLESYVARGVIAGAVTLIGRKGRLAHLAAYGHANIASATQMRPDHLFRMASMTKPVIGVAILQLVEEGKILLQEPVSAFVPSFAGQKVQNRFGQLEQAQREVTVKDLLTHTGGMGSATTGPSAVALEALGRQVSPQSTLATHVPRYGEVPLSFQPGAIWEYSGGPAFDTLAHICEVVSGQTIDVYLRERIFEPLAMHETTFNVAGATQTRVATVYQRGPNGLEEAEPLRFLNLSMQPGNTYFSGGGGLVGTAEDYGRFALALSNGGALDGQRILGRKTVALMGSDHTGAVPLDRTSVDLRGYRFGLSVRVLENAAEANTLASVGTFGWSGYFGTNSWIDPVEQMVGVVLVQREQDPNDTVLRQLAVRFQNTAYQALD